MVSEFQQATCKKKNGEGADVGLRKSVKWRILEVDWNNHGFPCNEQAKSEGTIDNIRGNLNHRHYLEKDASSCSIEIDLTKNIKNEKLIFERHVIIAKIIGPKLSRKDILAWVEFLDDHPLYIQPRSLNFDPTSLAVYDKPIWIRLYNLPIEYWSEACLETIGRSLGTLLEIDEAIIEGNLYTYARLKIAAVKTIPSSVMLLTADGEWKQHIEVEKEICASLRCGSKIHSADKCRLFVRRAFNRPHRKPK
ncbi:hypothetical protein SUGI_0626790 [Cryptomeria japonica]|nr:hypothetical protein SUGI_0626790 [Cryptomeria japonica]